MFEIGNSLKEARERRALDMVDVEHETKIRSKYLTALEREDFEVLPNPAYAKGFLRTYAQYLGLDGQVFVDEFNTRFAASEDQHDDPSTPLGRRSRRQPSVRLVAILSLVAVAAVLGVRLTSTDDSAVREPSDDVRTSAGQVADDSEPADVQTPTSAGVAAGSAAQRVARADAPAVARLVARADDGSSWVEVRRDSADGTVVFQGTLDQGTQKTWTGRRLVVTVGYPAAVTLRHGTTSRKLTGSDTQRYMVTAARLRLL